MTTANPAEVIPPVIVPIYEGNPATLSWNYSLTADLIIAVLRFNGGGIVSIQKNGEPSDVNIYFRDRFTVSSTAQSATLFISHVTVADDEANGDFTCNLIDSDGNTWKRAIQLKVLGKITGCMLTVKKALHTIAECCYPVMPIGSSLNPGTMWKIFLT